MLRGGGVSWIVASTVIAMGGHPTRADLGTMGDYVVTGGSLNIIRGTSAIVSAPFVGNPGQHALAVGDTIRTMGMFSHIDGREYGMDGTWTGVTYTNPGSAAFLVDGATDGLHNYAITRGSNSVWRFDTDWSNPELLFQTPFTEGNRNGITYDPVNDSLWVSGSDNGTRSSFIENRTMDGTLLSSFSTGHDNNSALAMDYSDSTLWVFNGDTASMNFNDFEQYDRTGALLQSFGSQVGSVSGGEFQFQPVPAPGAAFLGALGLGMVSLIKRRSALA